MGQEEEMKEETDRERQREINKERKEFFFASAELERAQHPHMDYFPSMFGVS